MHVLALGRLVRHFCLRANVVMDVYSTLFLLKLNPLSMLYLLFLFFPFLFVLRIFCYSEVASGYFCHRGVHCIIAAFFVWSVQLHCYLSLCIFC